MLFITARLFFGKDPGIHGVEKCSILGMEKKSGIGCCARCGDRALLLNWIFRNESSQDLSFDKFRFESF